MTNQVATNITWHERQVTREERHALLKQKGVTIWFTGLSASGKSTIAVALEKALIEQGKQGYTLDGDNVRHGLNKDLGFSHEDREENIRRIGEVAGLIADAGIIVLSSFISPYTSDRRSAREIHERTGIDFVECYVKVPLEVAEARDPKGLYKKARAGEIKGFTGLDDPYEEPENPEIVLETDKLTVQQCVEALMKLLDERGILHA